MTADVERLIDERPGMELMAPAYDDPAHPVAGFIYRSGGTTASYLIVTDGGRIVVNTGMGYEAPHHKRVFDAVCAGPTPFIITTQAHVDHVGGVDLFRAAGTRYVAQANNQVCQADDARIAPFRVATAAIWFDISGTVARRIAAENPGVPMRQARPVPDITFERRLGLTVGDLALELIATPGGETIDSCVVWLPQHRICLVSNLFGPLFPHFPNFNTLRGDRYRFVEPYLAAVRTVRELQPEVLITGRHLPIEGAELIDAALARLHDAVDYVHRRTLEGINAQVDLPALMREVRLPPELRVGEGYGTVAWAVRTIWESYTGWFRRRSTTELYPDELPDALSGLVALSGADAVVEQARVRLEEGRPLVAIHLAEALLAAGADEKAALGLLIDAHQRLLADGAARNFWAAGWINDQLAEFRSRLDP